jgi:hypothetical protein
MPPRKKKMKEDEEIQYYQLTMRDHVEAFMIIGLFLGGYSFIYLILMHGVP